MTTGNYTLGEYQAELANGFVFLMIQIAIYAICIWCVFVITLCIFMSLMEIVYTTRVYFKKIKMQ